MSVDKVIVEYSGPARAFIFEGVEFVRGVAQTVDKDIADLLKRVDPEHAFAVTEPEAPKAAEKSQETYSTTAQSSGLSEDDSPAPE